MGALRRGLSPVLCLILACSSSFALKEREHASRFDAKVLEAPGQVIAVRAASLAELPATSPLRSGWDAFSARHGGWEVNLDQRSALPTLAQGAGIPWLDGSEADPVAALEARARAFLAENRLVLGDWARELVLDREASGRASDTAFNLTFRQVIDGVPVDGARFDFHVVQGRLVAFGADRWARATTPRAPRVSAADARAALLAYLEVEAGALAALSDGELRLAPVDPRGVRAAAWEGTWGDGLTHLLVWRFAFHAPGEDARFVADVDALAGRVVSLADTTMYDRVKGGVFPIAPDGLGPEGTEQPGAPMPFADVSLDGGPKQTASASGLFACTPGQSIRTTLSNPYVLIANSCGAVSEAAVCGEGIDLQTGPGTNCEIPAGASAGNTRGARSAFHNVNRSAERARYWLPDNAWVRNPVQVNVNVNATCNASWGGQLNMYKAGNGCGNTAELHGVLVHEWGHGFDQNDGGGYDNTSEGYADVVAAYDARLSCIGRGFDEGGGNCSGYGDTCLNCTGVRDIDWNARTFKRPATPQDFLTNQCGGGGGPCGKETHCEGYVGAEALWDLAVRDLPASGLDAASAWQLADRLWHQSRKGSGGNAYNCALPSSDGCGTNSWFHKLRVADDDDGNLNNGTPHAAAIYAAFARHNIACGAASDASNQNASSCPSLARPSVAVTIADGGLRLDWAPVPNATRYRVLRADFGCNRAQVPVADVAAPATTFLDTDVPEGWNVSYRVQAIGGNAACESPVSECRTAALQPLVGRLEFSRSAYACGSALTVRVRDGNAGPGPLAILAWSDGETVPEQVTLAETSPGSALYEGTLPVTAGPPVAGDGALVVAGGDQVTAQYVDATGAASVDTAVADCSAAAPSAVEVTDITDGNAVVRWTTAEPTTGVVEWGPTAALGRTAADTNLATTHAVTLTGLDECARYHFRVRATDRSGNQVTLDAGGAPFTFNARRVPGFFRDSFEAANGWSLNGEWQIDVPQGRGASPGDPTAAWGGSKVLGHDLTGLGASSGNYEKSRTAERAISKAISATGKTGVELKFQRWLNQGTNATAAVEVRVPAGTGGTWTTVWERRTSFFPSGAESAWTEQTVDISPQVDGAASFQVAFRMDTNSQSSNAAGWNVDRFVVRQKTDPVGEACGGCAGAPTFGGIASVADGGPCAAGGGTTLAWDPAPAWGTGGGGTYSVYRDTTPNFTPSAANRIATGLAATTYADATAADGVTYHYLVRAENDEACGGGPANGGVVDANTAYRSITPAGSQAAPGGVTALKLQPRAGADLRLDWNAASSASSYNVLRSFSFTPGTFGTTQSTAATIATLPGDGGDGTTWFYLVRGVNACSQEGP